MIGHFQNGNVTFRYTHARTSRSRRFTLPRTPVHRVFPPARSATRLHQDPILVV